MFLLGNISWPPTMGFFAASIAAASATSANATQTARSIFIRVILSFVPARAFVPTLVGVYAAGIDSDDESGERQAP